MKRIVGSFCALLALAGGSAGCAARPAAPVALDGRRPAVRAAPEPSRPEPLLPAVDVKTIVSQRQGLEFDVPDGSAWKLDDVSTSWLVGTHRRSESTLSVKTWRAGRVVNRQDCEREAKSAAPTLRGLEGSTLSERRVGRPEGFDTSVALRVWTDADGGMRGSLVAFGANVRRCLAVVFVTRAVGQNAERVLGDRLGLVDRIVLDGLRQRSVEDRARRAPLP